MSLKPISFELKTFIWSRINLNQVLHSDYPGDTKMVHYLKKEYYNNEHGCLK